VSRAQRREAPLIRLSYRKGEAAAVLGVSEDTFALIAHEIPCVRRGRVVLYSASALQDWLDENAERVLSERAA
jgi:excisionase family DNA binding protein